MADDIAEIRLRINLVDLIESGGTKLKKTGKNYVGLCPFHPDKHPSMTVNPVFGRYKCFSCGANGDIFTWIMNTQSVQFSEAMRILAHKAGVELTQRSARPSVENKGQLKQQLELMEFASRFYQNELKKNSFAKNYCQGRNLSQDLLDTWQLGYSSDIEIALTTAVQRNGFPLSVAADLNIVQGDQSNGFRDQFRQRLMFPIRNEHGSVVAFGGRIIGDGVPKYLNSSDTPIFQKGNTLYGLFESRQALTKNRHALLVEGYMDVLACHGAGLKFAVASLGTSLTDGQANLLRKWSDYVTVAYDGDAAGRHAASRACEILTQTGIKVRVSVFDSGDDPDTIVQKLGPAGLEKIISNPVPPLDFNLASLELDYSPNTAEFWTAAIPLIASAATELEITRSIDFLAGKYPGIQDVVAARRALRTEVAKIRKSTRKTRFGPTARTETVVPNAVVPSANLFDTPLNPGEAALFFAYLADVERAKIHEFLKEPCNLISASGIKLANMLVVAFPNEPPQGEPSQWIHLVKEATQTLINLNSDRYGVPTVEYVQDSMETLLRMRQTQSIRSGPEQGSELLEAINVKLRELKKDSREKV